MKTKSIILRNSVQQTAYTDSLDNPKTETGKLFRVIQGGMARTKHKAQNIERAIDGTADVSIGSITLDVKYTIRVAEENYLDDEAVVSDPLDANDVDIYLGSNIGTMADLDDYFMLNNPNPGTGSPNNLITIIDHLGEVLEGFLIGEFTPQPMTTLLEGQEAFYIIQIDFLKKAPLS